MKKSIFRKAGVVIAFAVIAGTNAHAQSKAELVKQIQALTASNVEVSKNLKTFDTLDYTIFSNRDWTRLHESHAKDILVHFPDGHTEKGLDQHIKTLDAMFVYAPDTRIKEHPFKLGNGNLTAVMGYMEGTFTQPMPIGNGQFIQPTGKSFRIPMATIGVWKDNVMSEEYLFWDNKAYMDQLGIGK